VSDYKPRVRPPRALEDEALKLIRQMLECLDDDIEEGKTVDCLNEWEIGFLNSVRPLATLSLGQANKVIEIHEKFSQDYSGEYHVDRCPEEDSDLS